MLLTLSWLKDYLAKPDIKLEPRELAERLTMRGIAVSSVRDVSHGIQNVFIGRIEKIDKHPNADRLQVTQVILSSEPNAELRQIVCGAKNISVGDIVPIALPGCILPDDTEIKVSSIRGVESFGMICSAPELGMQGEHEEGILQLPKNAPIGNSLSSFMGGGGIEDTVLEFELTPNRGDCLSVIGIAREVAPLLKTKIREPKPARFRTSAHRTSSIIKVEVEDPVCCPRYVARVVDGVKVTDSPDWLKQRLSSVGIPSINNIVDVTNFVMLEYGQPLHAFDLRKIESGSLRIGPCKTPSLFTTLNGETVMLQEGDILIQDGDRPVALAGIMGGANSHIDADTTSIILESAVFQPEQIRRTAKRLNLHTDASKRFEKGVDALGVGAASERAAEFLRDTFNANVYHPPIDTNEFGIKEESVAVDMRDVRRVTGLKHLSTETVTELLETIGINAHRKSINIMSIRLPSFRPDLRESIDIIEEIARLNGYDQIPQNYPISISSYDRIEEGQYEFENRAKRLLVNNGFRETIHYSFTSEQALARYGFASENPIKLQNPISEEMKVMRTTLLPSLLHTYSHNRNRRIRDQKLFELAHVYAWDSTEETRVKETPMLAGLISGSVTPSSWRGGQQTVDFYFAKALVELLGRQLTTVFLAFEPLTQSKLFHPKRAAVIKLGLKEVGVVGEVHPFVRQNYLDTTDPVVLFELNLDAARKYERNQVRFKTPSRFPSSEVDIAVTVDEALNAQQLIDSIRHTGGALLTEVSLFDVYVGTNIPSGKKSLAFHLTFLSPERTLQDTEVIGLRDRIVQVLTEKFGAQLRA